MTVTAHITVLAPWVADAHERTPGATCLLAPEGTTCCPQPAAYRIDFVPLPGHERGHVSFVCTDHATEARTWPHLATIRTVRP